MEIKSSPFGNYETNCYICSKNGKSIIIDPGIGATEWVINNAPSPIAILCTHGHFDHIWSCKELKEKLSIPLYIHQGDSFLCENDPFGMGMPCTKADFTIDNEESLEIEDFLVIFHHFAGHTPGCSIIQVDGLYFSGDFIFKGSIGRTDFPYSDSQAMRKSLQKFAIWDNEATLYPGHGGKTTIKTEQRSVPTFLTWL